MAAHTIPAALEQKRLRAVRAVERILSYDFSNTALLAQALTHPSAVEACRTEQSYERLEFLGDAVLGALIACEAYALFPELDEGHLTRIKVHLVSGKSLSEKASKLGLEPYIVFGKSESGKASRGHSSALENVFEAIVGALYLDGGLAAARTFVKKIFLKDMAELDLDDLADPKSKLQALLQKRSGVTPTYVLQEKTGPAHLPRFVYAVMQGKKKLAEGEGSSKKKAEIEAAEHALKELE